MATSEFGKAFAAARKAGDKSFEFNGKKYTTKTADDAAKEKPKAEYSNEGRRTPAPAAKSPTADDTSLSLSERSKLSRERARAGSGATDTRSVNERMREAVGMKKGGSIDGIAKRGRTKCKTV